MRQERLGGLGVRIVGGVDGGGGGDGPMVVLLHGFGAPGGDLVPLAREIPAAPGVRFLFPEAPLVLGGFDFGFGESRAWWMIDLSRIERAQRTGSIEPFTDDVPDGLVESRAMVVAMLDEAQRALGAGPLILGGFSQGAMLSCDVALHDPRPLAGLVLMSGALIARSEWAPRAAMRRGLRVVQSHGTEDPLLPFAAGEALRELLRAGGAEVDWVPFRGGHTIAPPVLPRVGALIASASSTAT
jgi:phospholipase/carboxylesterase